MSYESQLSEATESWLRARDETTERDFCDALEMWIGTQVPSSSEFYERWWDGLYVDEYRVDGPSLIISGEIWHIRQRLHPFEAELRRTDSGWLVVTVRFADEALAAGRAHRRTVLIGMPRRWRFTLPVP